MSKVNLAEKFSRFSEHWNPKIVAELNGQQVKLVKLKGEFIWHSHEHEDELFLVVKGQLTMRFRNQEDIIVNEGEFIVVPKKTEHLPVAEDEVHILLFEPAGTLNTGDKNTDRTIQDLERL